MRLYLNAVLALPTLVLAACVWDYTAAGKLYFCSDSCGPADFIPPFVHPSAGDYYLAPVWFVWSFWALLVVLAFVIPAIVIQTSLRFYGRTKEQNAN